MIAEPLRARRRDPKYTEGEETEEEGEEGEQRWGGQPHPEPRHRLYDMKVPRKNRLVSFPDVASVAEEGSCGSATHCPSAKRQTAVSRWRC